MPRENADVVRQAYEAFNRRDLAAVKAVMHASVRFGTTVETHHSPEGVPGWILQADQIFDSFTIEVEELIEAGDQVVAMVHERGHGRDSGLKIDQHFAHVWSLSDGRVLNFQSFTERGAALGAVGLQA